MFGRMDVVESPARRRRRRRVIPILITKVHVGLMHGHEVNGSRKVDEVQTAISLI